jgi:hypothetical protein
VATVNSLRLTNVNTLVSIKTVNSTVSESTNGRTVERILATTKMTKKKDLAYIRGQMVRSTRVTGAMVSKTASAASQIQKTNHAWAAGKTANALYGCKIRRNRKA